MSAVVAVMLTVVGVWSTVVSPVPVAIPAVFLAAVFIVTKEIIVFLVSVVLTVLKVFWRSLLVISVFL